MVDLSQLIPLAVYPVIVALTLYLVAGVRKLAPLIDGPLPVLAVGTALGVVARLLVALVLREPLTWAIAAEGPAMGAAAFGYANWQQWRAAASAGGSNAGR